MSGVKHDNRSRPLSQGVNRRSKILGKFMMGITALSLPEFVILRRVLKPQLLAVFIGTVAAGIVAVGYLFNFLVS